MKQAVRLQSPAVITAALSIAVGLGLNPCGARAGAPPPPPPPPPGPSLNPTLAPTTLPTPLPSGVPVPTASPSGGGRHRGRRSATPGPASSPVPTPTATPTSPAFSSLDGTWEVQLQYIDHTDYSYFVLREGSAGGLTGQWRVDKNSYPLTGSYDGRLIKLAVTTPTATVAFNGYVEAAQDMVGETDYNDKAGQETPWTAEHRGKAPEPHPTHRKGRLG